jgi:hypothetical protein
MIWVKCNDLTQVKSPSKGKAPHTFTDSNPAFRRKVICLWQWTYPGWLVQLKSHDWISVNLHKGDLWRWSHGCLSTFLSQWIPCSQNKLLPSTHKDSVMVRRCWIPQLHFTMTEDLSRSQGHSCSEETNARVSGPNRPSVLTWALLLICDLLLLHIFIFLQLKVSFF